VRKLALKIIYLIREHRILSFIVRMAQMNRHTVVHRV